MRDFFFYDSKPMQVLLFAVDLILLNFLFLFCCIPIFTIGAAQAGLYTGIRILMDPEDDSSCVSAFFRGFKSGFRSITLIWCLQFVTLLFLVWLWNTCRMIPTPIGKAALALSTAGIVVCVCMQSQLPLYHSRFQCTGTQLMFNSLYMVLTHPLRGIGVAAVTWAPVAVAFWNLSYFLKISPVWLLVYYSAAFLAGFTAMKKPYQMLIDSAD